MLNTLTILSFFIIVFLGLLAGVGYCCDETGFTSHPIFSILKISLFHTKVKVISTSNKIVIFNIFFVVY
jgi:hypothetical protein